MRIQENLRRSCQWRFRHPEPPVRIHQKLHRTREYPPSAVQTPRCHRAASRSSRPPATPRTRLGPKAGRRRGKESGRQRLPAPLRYSVLWWCGRASGFLPSCGGISRKRGRSSRRSPDPATQPLEIKQTLFSLVAPEKDPATTAAEVAWGSQGAIIAPCLLSFFCFAAAATIEIPPVGGESRPGG